MVLWFQHMHKVAGSTIVRIAHQNNMKMYPYQSNGNPRYNPNDPRLDMGLKKYHTYEIRYDRFSTLELLEFIESINNLGVEFIACEWGFPKEMLIRDDIYYVTCFRDPWERAMSNYNYDKNESPGKFTCFEDWANREYIYSRDNYYTSILCGKEDLDNHILNEEDYQKALDNLKNFNLVLILENPRCFDLLELMLGWSHTRQTFNKTSKKTYPSDEFKQIFIERNQYDYRLYQEAINMMQTKLNNLNFSEEEWSIHNQFSGMNYESQCELALNIGKLLDNANMKETAVMIYRFILKKLNSSILKLIYPDLANYLKYYPEYARQTIHKLPKYKIDYIFKLIHHLSYMAYYTNDKDLGKMMCLALIHTKIPNQYREHCQKSLTYY